jgi:eukaryotic-like serine/threonine-protein kinase
VKVGELVADRFELEALAGEGGMSSVFRARDTVLERRVALKVLHEHYARDAEYVERFRREARAIARLTHPNIVTVIDRGEWKGRQYIVFEHVSGESLEDVVEREGPLPVERAIELTLQIGRALAFAHEAGIVHRDVKPHNVLIDLDGDAKIADFGVARSLDADDGLTETGTLLGTSTYIAPEQASGERVDERSDQYSLGVLFYELLTGDVPYPGTNPMAVAVRHLHDPVPSVRASRPEVPERVEAVITRAMAKRPADRFPSMGAMTAALEACLSAARRPPRPSDEEDTGVIRAPPPPRRRPERRKQPSRSRPRAGVVLLLLAAATALVVGLLAAQMGLNDEDVSTGNGGDGSAGTVRLRAVSDFDPQGGDGEHPEAVPAATDGDQATYWTTETYSNFSKSGVGIVLAAQEPVALSRLVVVTSEPGFRAKIQAGTRRSGPFADVSEERRMSRRATFELDTGGEEYRFYVVWITSLSDRAIVNEVRAG